jgi:Putative prokaryotic signal transducing protein
MSSGVSTVTVFSGSGVEASMVLSFLESNGISARLEGEYVGTTAPHLAAAGGAGAVKVAVAAGDAASAKELLAERRNHT